MRRLIPGTFAAVVVMSLAAFAERPAPRQRAAPELFVSSDLDARTPGARFLDTLPAATREALRKNGQVVLDQKAAGDTSGQVRAVIRFERSADEVFAALTRPSEQVSYMPSVTQSKEIGRASCRERV